MVVEDWDKTAHVFATGYNHNFNRRRNIMSKKDDLAGIIADELNKQFKQQKVTYFLRDGDGSPTEATD